MIEVRGVEVTFNPGTPLETRALRGVDLLVPAGQFVTVIGGNGAGKSTLLGAVAGDARVSRGRVLIGGRDVTGLPAAARARHVARVFQDPLAGSCAPLTLEENLALASSRSRRRGLALALRPSDRDGWRERLRTLGLGLEGRLGDRMDRFSGGQRQAAALLMATLASPEVLLLDEHTAALDPRTAALVLDLTRRLVAEAGPTTLMVTHSMRQAIDLGDRLLMLHEGRIALDLAGPAKAGLTVQDLLDEFGRTGGGAGALEEAPLLG